MNRSHSNLLHKISVGVRVCGTILCISYILWRLDLTRLTEFLVHPRLPFLFAFILLTPIFVSCSVLRWYLLLRTKGAETKFGTLLRIYFVGSLFNQVLPSTIGGDVFRVYATRKYSVPTDLVVASVFVDRFTGLFTLLISVIVTWVIIAVQTKDGRFLLAAGLLIMAGGTIFWVIAGTGLERFYRNPPAGQAGKAVAALASWHAAVRAYRENLSCLVGAIALSFVFIFLSGLNYLFGVLTFQSGVYTQKIFLIVPTVLLLGNLPVSIGGWGLQELAAVVVFNTAGFEGALGLSVALLIRAKTVVLGLIGGILYLIQFYPHNSRKPIQQENHEI